MRFTRFGSLLLIGLSLIATSPQRGDAQLGGLRRKAEEARKKVEESSTKKTSSDTAKTPADAGKTTAPASSGRGSPATLSQGSAASAKVWENYDFVPGSKVLFFTDFSEDRVGNFARGLKYVGGPAEVIERDGVKMLRSTGRSTMLIPVGRPLPPRFTLEVDILSTSALVNLQLAFEGGPTLDRGDQSAEITWAPSSAFIIGGGQNAGTSTKSVPADAQEQYIDVVTHIRVLMDESYFKMYANERRLYNIPELQFRRAPEVRLLITGSEETPTFITGIRVAESDTDVLYDALASKGRWATHGILFATGKADLQPESRPVLKEIAETMKKYADLKLLIEGHTDNVGSPASNLALSDARAAAVKAALVSTYAVDAARLTTKGFGDTKPSTPNATATSRAQNRRVELVKQ
jgi:OOP family OmpA-OmpF porin